MKEEEPLLNDIDNIINEEIQSVSIENNVEDIQMKLKRNYAGGNLISSSKMFGIAIVCLFWISCASLGFFVVKENMSRSKDLPETIYFNEIVLESLEKNIINP